jgi:hypothetical protein
MCCIVLFLDFRTLRRGGSAGELGEEVTEMTLSGLGSKFLLRRKRAGGEREGTRSRRGREEERCSLMCRVEAHRTEGTWSVGRRS